MKREFLSLLGCSVIFALLFFLASGCFLGNLPHFPNLHPQVDLGGKVVDALSGEGISGAEVTLRDFPSRSDVTASDGTFFLPLVPSGRQVVLVSVFGYASRSEVIEVPEEGPFWVEIALLPLLGKVVGFVFNESGQLLSSVEVTLDGKQSTQSNENGAFSFEEVPVGAHVLVFEKEGYLPSVEEITVEENSVVVLEVTLSKPGGSVKANKDQ
ncbi:MAG TPA: carboxypeptidase regulatory-like domain-containing protein [Candidatus Atribacteria bacterium]|nr:carboxypeptidase regulatory-like domain-containing protein [Candidatus Atribacteria bacterium]